MHTGTIASSRNVSSARQVFRYHIYTGKAFDVRDAVEFTREHLRADPVEHKSF